MLTPVDLQTRDFRKSFRGYDTHDVDEYMDRVLAEFDRLFRTNIQQRDEIEAMKKRIEEYRQMESNLRDTLMMAQDASQQFKAAAARESDLVVAEAREKARKIVEMAEESILAKKSELEDLRKREEFFKIRFKSLLESYLSSLGEPSPEPASAPAPVINASAIFGIREAAAAMDVEGDR